MPSPRDRNSDQAAPSQRTPSDSPNDKVEVIQTPVAGSGGSGACGGTVKPVQEMSALADH
jgi:hypothetical protein